MKGLFSLVTIFFCIITINVFAVEAQVVKQSTITPAATNVNSADTGAAARQLHKKEIYQIPDKEAVKASKLSETEIKEIKMRKDKKYLQKIWRIQQFKKLTQNIDNPIDFYKFLHNHIGFGGLAIFDVSDSGSSLAGIKNNFSFNVNKTISLHAGIFFSDSKDRYYPTFTTNTGIDLDESYLLIKNFNQSPFYIKLGRQYLPFGRYNHFQILPDLPNKLMCVRANAAQAGFIFRSGIYGAIYGFYGLPKVDHGSNEKFNNYGATIGVRELTNPFGFDLNLSYINNLGDAGSIAANFDSHNYIKKVDGVSANIDIFSGPFDYGIRYVTALNHFEKSDLAFSRDQVPDGASPSAGLIDAGYNFKTFGNKNSRIKIAYQWSKQAYDATKDMYDALKLPRYRINMTYAIEVYKNIIIAAQIARDRNYQERNGGNNEIDHTCTLRFVWLM